MLIGSRITIQCSLHQIYPNGRKNLNRSYPMDKKMKTVYKVMDLGLVAHLAAIESSLPVLHFFELFGEF